MPILAFIHTGLLRIPQAHLTFSSLAPTKESTLEFLNSSLRHCGLKVVGLLHGSWRLTEWACQ